VVFLTIATRLIVSVYWTMTSVLSRTCRALVIDHMVVGQFEKRGIDPYSRLWRSNDFRPPPLVCLSLEYEWWPYFLRFLCWYEVGHCSVLCIFHLMDVLVIMLGRDLPASFWLTFVIGFAIRFVFFFLWIESWVSLFSAPKWQLAGFIWRNVLLIVVFCCA